MSSIKSNSRYVGVVFWRLVLKSKSLWFITVILGVTLFLHLRSSNDSTYVNPKDNLKTLNSNLKLTEIFNGIKNLEDENAANEIIEDGENEEEKIKNEQKFHRINGEDNAAREVNSYELNLNQNKKINEKDLEVENNFHQIPNNQINNLNLNAEFQQIREMNNWRNLSSEQVDSLSVLGRRLYLQENVGQKIDKNFTIVIWRFGPSIERRLIKNYGKVNKDPFRSCSVRNCNISYLDEDMPKADAILFHMHRIPGPPINILRINPKQIWVWLTDENPHHMFMSAKDKNISHYNGYFNWSMHYRFDADVPVPYGRTIPLPQNQINLLKYRNIYKTKNGTVAIMASNCGGSNKRFKYVKILKEYMTVDFYGGCGDLKCKGHFTLDCPLLNHYLFYLAFENGDCKYYITEKVFWNALAKRSVPIVMGGRKEQYKQVLPPNSFIHIDDFQSIEHLAKYIKYLISNEEEYSKYHAWRSKYIVVNEHGYFGTDNYHYCRLCEALNYNSYETKTYNHLNEYWNKIDDCYDPTWNVKEEKLGRQIK